MDALARGDDVPATTDGFVPPDEPKREPDPLTALADYVTAHRAEGMQAQVLIDADMATVQIITEGGLLHQAEGRDPAGLVRGAITRAEQLGEFARRQSHA